MATIPPPNIHKKKNMVLTSEAIKFPSDIYTKSNIDCEKKRKEKKHWKRVNVKKKKKIQNCYPKSRIFVMSSKSSIFGHLDTCSLSLSLFKTCVYSLSNLKMSFESNCMQSGCELQKGLALLKCVKAKLYRCHCFPLKEQFCHQLFKKINYLSPVKQETFQSL